MGPKSDVRNEIVCLLPRLRRFALVLTRSPDLADELVQAGVVRALGRLDQRSRDTPLDRWLFCILKTVWLNTQRSSTIRRADPLEEHSDVLVSDGVRDMEAKVTLSEVRAAFARLTCDQQQALLLVCVEGYSYADAAELLGIPIGTLMSRLSRARDALIVMANARTHDNVTPFPAGAGAAYPGLADGAKRTAPEIERPAARRQKTTE
jgi:RNA polymerase sigma-70 factor (ECF subfamily)